MEKTTVRMKLFITTVNDVIKVGERQVDKLSFKAKESEDGKELTYFSFRSSLFEAIKPKAIIEADVEMSSHEYEGTEYIDRRVVQIYEDGQPLGGKKQGYQGGYRGKSPEELEYSLRSQCLSYCKDLCLGEKIGVKEIIGYASQFYAWAKAYTPDAKPTTNPDGTAKVPETKKSKPETTKEPAEKQDTPARVDVAWLDDSLKSLKWNESTVKSYLKSTYHIETTGVLIDCLDRLDNEQLAGFISEVQNRLEML